MLLILERLGLHADIAQNGAEAVALFQTAAGYNDTNDCDDSVTGEGVSNYAVVLLDIQMPSAWSVGCLTCTTAAAG